MSQKIDVFHTIAITARIILAKSFSYFFTVYFVHCSFITNTKSLGHYINFRAITVSVDYPSHSDWLSLRCKP